MDKSVRTIRMTMMVSVVVVPQLTERVFSAGVGRRAMQPPPDAPTNNWRNDFHSSSRCFRVRCTLVLYSCRMCGTVKGIPLHQGNGLELPTQSRNCIIICCTRSMNTQKGEWRAGGVEEEPFFICCGSINWNRTNRTNQVRQDSELVLNYPSYIFSLTSLLFLW